MSKRSLVWNEEKYNKFIKENRGRGEGKNYTPWLNIQDFPSQGKSSRIFGIKTQRMHSLFSDIETRCFYIFDWSSKVIDIREQFPLLELEEVMRIAEESRVNYPCNRESKFPIVMTTDFLITMKDENGVYDIARTVKPSSVLDNKRVMEKYEVERRYWAERNVDWGIVTEKEIPLNLIQNIQRFHSFYNFEIKEVSNSDFKKIAFLLKDQFALEIDIPIQQICFNFDEKYNLKNGIALGLFRHLVARKEIVLNIQAKFDVNKTLNELKVVPDNELGAVSYDI